MLTGSLDSLETQPDFRLLFNALRPDALTSFLTKCLRQWDQQLINFSRAARSVAALAHARGLPPTDIVSCTDFVSLRQCRNFLRWHFTHRKSPSLCLGTPNKPVHPQWFFTHSARTSPSLDTGHVDHLQSRDSLRWHFTHRKSPSLCLGTPNKPGSPQWLFTHSARTAPSLDTGLIDHRQSRDFLRWHFTHSKLPSFSPSSPNNPGSDQQPGCL